MLELLIAVTVNWTRLQLKLFLVDETIGRVLLMLPVCYWCSLALSSDCYSSEMILLLAIEPASPLLSPTTYGSCDGYLPGEFGRYRFLKYLALATFLPSPLAPSHVFSPYAGGYMP